MNKKGKGKERDKERKGKRKGKEREKERKGKERKGKGKRVINLLLFVRSIFVKHIDFFLL